MSEVLSLSVAVLSVDQEDSSSATFLTLFDVAVRESTDLIVIPFGFPSLNSKDAHRLFAQLAKSYRVHIIAGWKRRSRPVARVYSPTGRVLGDRVQAHRLPEETFSPGRTIEPVSTTLGLIGISIGSDIYFPEMQWSQTQQGADILVHLGINLGVENQFYQTISPKVRALDCQRPFLLSRASSRYLKVAHNEELQIPGTPMSGSIIIDQNGSVLASTGYSQGVARANLRTYQHCQSKEEQTNIPVNRGLDIWKLYFNDSRAKYFTPLCHHFPRPHKPKYRKRKVTIAVLNHHYSHQLGKDDSVLFQLLEEACSKRPDIVVCTEMEQNCRPDDPQIASKIKRLVDTCKKARCYLLVGGIRFGEADAVSNRCSHAWLWNRRGKMVFQSRIMLYGRGFGQDVYDCDFGRIGIRLCGDVYAPELDRLFARKAVDIVFNPSMSWAASGGINSEIGQARAMDNGFYIVNAHLAFSDPGQRSQVFDPLGNIIAASSYYANSVLVSHIDLDSPRGIFVHDGKRKVDPGSYLASYRSTATYRLLSHQELFKRRKPDLYTKLAEDNADHPFSTRNRGDGCILPRPTSIGLEP